ncbi:MAG TPA: zf-HC2 domain-containing protein [Acidimicrobiia bacterium]|nr:zf-HC2 domain-containing protein [Acidimicrobiia bacterium]
MPFARRDIVCREAVELMTDYLEGALPWRARRRLERHLAACPHCSEYLEQIREIVAAAGRVEVDDLPPDAVDDLVGLYRRWQSE